MNHSLTASPLIHHDPHLHKHAVNLKKKSKLIWLHRGKLKKSYSFLASSFPSNLFPWSHYQLFLSVSDDQFLSLMINSHQRVFLELLFGVILCVEPLGMMVRVFENGFSVAPLSRRQLTSHNGLKSIFILPSVLERFCFAAPFTSLYFSVLIKKIQVVMETTARFEEYP